MSNTTLDSNEALNDILAKGNETFSNLKKSAFGQFLKDDYNAIKKAGSRAFESFGYEERERTKMKAERSSFEEAGGSVDSKILKADEDLLQAGMKERKLGNIGNSLLDDLGKGNNVAGGAKLGGYMIGTAMLADLLNPFGD